MQDAMAGKFRLIDETTDISKLKMTKYDWDATVREDHVPYQVAAIPGYVHTIQGMMNGENCLWMWPRFEEPTYENMIEVANGCQFPIWGIQQNDYNCLKWLHGEKECIPAHIVIVTRNGAEFCQTWSITEAQHIIYLCQDHPLGLGEYQFDQKAIGRKVWWRSEPAIITRYVHGQACVVLEPDGIEKFTVPAEFQEEHPNYYEDGFVKDSIFSPHIWWFRN